ncbi:MAG: hypothetical protein WAW92_04460 [Minisyncoccia bacterium]
MFKKIVIVVVIIVISLDIFFLFSAYQGQKIYKSFFRISYEDVISNLNETEIKCRKISECKLKPGDILLRRYLTPQTVDFDRLFDPYFTHSAFYLGDDLIFEASGYIPNKDDQVELSTLSESDWFNDDLHDFVIIRPKNYKDSLLEISNELKRIANDQTYLFGPYNEKDKTVSCSDIILKLLLDKGIIDNPTPFTKIITPDYLFWSIMGDRSNFDFVGYKLSPINKE